MTINALGLMEEAIGGGAIAPY